MASLPNYMSLQEQQEMRKKEREMTWTSRIQNLNLSDCKIKALGLTRLLTAIKDSVHLKTLNLDGNDFICPW